MAMINVLKTFFLNIDGALQQLEAGLRDVEEAVASHWYVKAHSESVADKEAAKVVEDEKPAEAPAETHEVEAPAAPEKTTTKGNKK